MSASPSYNEGTAIKFDLTTADVDSTAFQPSPTTATALYLKTLPKVKATRKRRAEKKAEEKPPVKRSRRGETIYNKSKGTFENAFTEEAWELLSDYEKHDFSLVDEEAAKRHEQEETQNTQTEGRKSRENLPAKEYFDLNRWEISVGPELKEENIFSSSRTPKDFSTYQNGIKMASNDFLANSHLSMAKASREEMIKSFLNKPKKNTPQQNGLRFQKQFRDYRYGVGKK